MIRQLLEQPPKLFVIRNRGQLRQDIGLVCRVVQQYVGGLGTLRDAVGVFRLEDGEGECCLSSRILLRSLKIHE